MKKPAFTIFCIIWTNILFGQNIQEKLYLDTLLYIDGVSIDNFTFSCLNDKVYYIKNIKRSNSEITMVEYDISIQRIEERNFLLPNNYLKELDQNLLSFSVEEDRITFLTQNYIYEFIQFTKNNYKLSREIRLQSKHAVRYLNIETFKGKIWVGRYNEMIPNKSPFFEWLFIDSNSSSFVVLFKEFDDTGKSLINHQKNYSTINKNILAYVSPIDSKIRIISHNFGRVSEEIIDFTPKGWSPFKREIIAGIEKEYERKPNYKLLDSIAYLEMKVYSSISHIALLDSNRILISYVINDTLKSQSNNFYSVTSEFYVDIWSKKGAKWLPEFINAKDYPITSKFNSDSLIKKNNFELLSAFAYSFKGEENKLLTLRTDGYPVFNWGDSWNDFYNKQRNGRLTGHVKPVLLIYNYLHK